MSHIVKVKSITILGDASLNRFKEAVKNNHGTYEGLCRKQIYQNQVYGHHFQLPGWKYTICVGVNTGTIKYDNFEGRWGDKDVLDSILIEYIQESICQKANKNGFNGPGIIPLGSPCTLKFRKDGPNGYEVMTAEIKPDCTFTIKTKNISGPKCKDAIDKIVSDWTDGREYEPTDEYYEKSEDTGIQINLQ